MIKLQKPKFVDDLEVCDDICEYIYDYETLRNKIIENKSICDIENIKVSMDSCIFKNVDFFECDFKKIDLVDVIFENCDLSNISFRDGSLYRVEFKNCKMIGSRLEDCTIKNVLFDNVLGKYMNLSFSKFKTVYIKESQFQNSVFQQATFEKIEFEETNLEESNFHQSSLKNIDFTTCNIDSIEVGIKEIEGCTLNTMQALDLTRLMKIKIK